MRGAILSGGNCELFNLKIDVGDFQFTRHGKMHGRTSLSTVDTSRYNRRRVRAAMSCARAPCLRDAIFIVPVRVRIFGIVDCRLFHGNVSNESRCSIREANVGPFVNWRDSPRERSLAARSRCDIDGLKRCIAQSFLRDASNALS
ncbi:hypothetical protein [Paraburkholderia acidisoli]|uniref:Uncharacterized protein n=1 Tax=Paraburkholderia acidisoli TaxID=2571748 RepID=A0A7Z2GLV0_9BURK|nr:hypothetical protein [Paraburkholderia acidisoli]QGZ64170.1 hypothetical protein FAZ98_20805 [Paraburkholderia acidisoli]